MVEIYIRNGFLLTMQGEGLGTIEEGAVAIDGSKILAVGKTAELDKTYKNADQIIEAKGKAVLQDLLMYTSIPVVQ